MRQFEVLRIMGSSAEVPTALTPTTLARWRMTRHVPPSNIKVGGRLRQSHPLSLSSCRLKWRRRGAR